MFVDYEKAYKEVLERARAGKPMNEVFPELKESEDERTREEIIKTISWIVPDCQYAIVLPREQKDKWIAWLEKQKEQKPAEWEEEYREEDLQIRFAFYTYANEPHILYLSNVFVAESSRKEGLGTRILEAADDVADTMRAHTIRLRVKKDSPAKEWYEKIGYKQISSENGYDWLEKDVLSKPLEEFIPVEKTLEYKMGFKKGVESVNSAEWGEEDERIWKDIFELCNRFGYDDACRKLKSLRPQQKQQWRKYHWHASMRFDKSALVKYDITGAYEIVTAGCRPRSEQNGIYVLLEDISPQPHWKPSEEQLGVLNYAYCELFKRGDVGHDILGPFQTLIDTLRKL